MINIRLLTAILIGVLAGPLRLPAPISEVATPTPAEIPAPTPPPTPVPQPVYDYQGFVLQHLQKCINRDILGIVADYSESVDYYENGTVGRSFIAQDRQKFSASWPTLSIQLTSPVLYDTSNAPTVTVTFSYTFEARNGRRISRGQADNRWTLLQTSDGLRITSEKQNITNRARR